MLTTKRGHTHSAASLALHTPAVRHAARSADTSPPPLPSLGRSRHRQCRLPANMRDLGRLHSEGTPEDHLDRPLCPGPATLGPADLVLLDPPLGGGRHVARWLRLAAELSPTGRAVVALPGDALRAGRREWTTVAERVVAVIACPALAACSIPERRRRCGCWKPTEGTTCWRWTPPHLAPACSESNRQSSWRRPSMTGGLGEVEGAGVVRAGPGSAAPGDRCGEGRTSVMTTGRRRP